MMGEFRTSSETLILWRFTKKVAKQNPLTIESVVRKLLERMVKHELDAHIENNGLIEDSQHRFRRGRSTATNLIKFLNVTTD